MKKYIKTYSFKGKYRIKERGDGDGFDVFNVDWDPHEPDFECFNSIEDAKQWILSNIAMDEQKKVDALKNVNEYAKKFKMLSEYSFWSPTLNEEEPPAEPEGEPGAEPPADPAGGDPNAMPPEDPNAAPEDGAMEPPADPAGGDPNAMPPEGEFEDIDIESEEDTMQPGDNVLDVSALTGSQDQTNAELQQLTAKFDQLIQLNDKVTQTLEMLAQSAEENKKEVQSVKDDLAQRVPTEIEKLKGRKSVSEPYEQSVEDYWQNRPGGDKYDIYNRNNQGEEQEYVLRKSDIEDINPQTIYSSFNQSLKDLVGY